VLPQDTTGASKRFLLTAYSTVATLGHMATKRRKPKGDRKEASIRLRLTDAEKEAFVKAAEREGRDLSNWIRWVAGRAAGMN
jgi:hypothetical protein